VQDGNVRRRCIHARCCDECGRIQAEAMGSPEVRSSLSAPRLCTSPAALPDHDPDFVVQLSDHHGAKLCIRETVAPCLHAAVMMNELSRTPRRGAHFGGVASPAVLRPPCNQYLVPGWELVSELEKGRMTPSSGGK
jgi:hypothetical protein